MAAPKVANECSVSSFNLIPVNSAPRPQTDSDNKFMVVLVAFYFLAFSVRFRRSPEIEETKS